MAITTFADKTVVVTGAASGIGRATAMAFAREGAHIVAADLHTDALEPVRQEVEALGVRCMSYAVDVADEAAMKTFAAAVQSRFGAPHVLINNAGIGYLGLFLRSDLEHWQRILDVNVMGVVHGCYFFLPMMIAAGGPRHLLNVSSSAGNFPSPSMGAYAASKGAVSIWTEGLKMELADSNVHVTTVCPGVINTPIVRNWAGVAPSVSDETLAKMRDYYQREGCAPEVVARAMVKAVRKNGDIVLSGPKVGLAYHVRRVSVKLIRAIMIDFSRKAGYL
ncbi:MAG: SDR family NAD(P)-dependent oxidoreductase [Halioglobus sp.]|nr:SDR family NAD(P)-dependent oxidoreductase [Halioglobus sp.]MCB1707451.1 SDR family NAD(P)-dependent oxidoreductase [Halioglobus sp.]MCP5123590.1 SDR family NAD(P)-dependent oxidoreductase [Pseudomonadales bacterium]MCP5193573.1 SDR family NAD(P)-dependent oxidoreductase [Pseudomonadales bacterium]